MLRYRKIGIRYINTIQIFLENNLDRFAKQFYPKHFSDKRAVTRFMLKEITEKLQNGTGLAAYNDSQLQAFGILSKSEWDSEILEKRTGRLNLYTLLSRSENEAYVLKMLSLASKNDLDVIFARVDITQIDVLQAILRKGAVLADILITFCRSTGKKQSPASFCLNKRTDITFEDAKVTDEKELRKITMASYGFSHYFNDPNIPAEKAGCIYRKWIEDSLRGYADFVITAKVSGKIVGYVTIRLEKLNGDGFSIIDLIAVSQKYRGRGIGKMLVNEGIARTYNKASKVYASTQASNLAALHLYHGLGFKPALSQAALHVWLNT